MGRFSELTSGIGRSVFSLADNDDQYNARSTDSMANRPFSVRSTEYDRQAAPKDDMRRYWRQYETTSIVRHPINTFANRVVEPGYYIEYDDEMDEETEEKLEHWLETCAIVEGIVGRDIRFILKKSIIQRDVRGTALTEVVLDESGENVTGLKLINPETIEINTRPGQSILLHPDDSDKWEDCPQTPDGEAAAYLQDLADTNTSWGISERIEHGSEQNAIAFTKDEIIKLTRDADVGEVFGTSRIESVSERIEGLKQKIGDNDEAIASKAYPLWLFKFGTEEAPWSRDDIDAFMKHHEVEDFHPGMKQGVRGDVDIDTVSGEVAEIAEYLDFDLNWILTAMPMPRYSLGAFSSDTASVSQEGAVGQENNINLQIKEARREIETEFTPVIRRKAEELGLSEDEAEKIRFRVGSPEGDDDTPTNIQEIRYKGKDSEEEDDNDDEEDGNPSNVPEVDAPSEEENTVWDEPGVAELARSEESELSSVISSTLIEARDDLLNELASTYSSSPKHAAYNFPSIANSQLTDSFRGREFRHKAEGPVDDALDRVYSENDHTSSYGLSRRHEKQLFVEDVENAAYEALDDMMSKIRIQISRGAKNGDEFDAIRRRIENEFSDSSIISRSNIIAQMELHHARETTKLSEFESNDEVVGVRINGGNPTTNVCKDLDGVEVYFADGDIGEQLREMVDDSKTKQSFDPLPSTPPYHYRCTTEMEAITDV